MTIPRNSLARWRRHQQIKGGRGFGLSRASLDADDVAGEIDQDRREGGAPCPAGDLPDGGGSNSAGIVPGHSGAD